MLLLSEGQTSFGLVWRVKTETDKNTAWAEFYVDSARTAQ